ncbi:MAG: hypothetical protein ACPGRC_01325 [Salibacteraceae bacterium]
MALKQLIVPLDDTEEGLSAFRFVLKNFGNEKNILTILWLGSKCVHPEKAIDVKLPHSMAKLDPMNSAYRLKIKAILESEFSDISTNINVITIDNFTRKQLTNYCDYGDSLFSTFSVYMKHIYPLFANYSVGRKYTKICCPKILISNEIEHTDNIVLVKTDQVNTIATVKQFCHVYSEKCIGKELNLLDLQEFTERGGAFNSQRMLVEYLKNHVSSPAIYPYSGEDPTQLSSILNLNKNTVWVSPLESVEEVKFLSKR